MGGSRARPAVMAVILALRASAGRLCGRIGRVDEGRRCGWSGGGRLAQHRRQRIRPGVARYVFGDEHKPGERWKRRLLDTT